MTMMIQLQSEEAFWTCIMPLYQSGTSHLFQVMFKPIPLLSEAKAVCDNTGINVV
jgi:hypothetical protein